MKSNPGTHIHTMFFSPCGNVKRIVTAIGESLINKEIKQQDPNQYVPESNSNLTNHTIDITLPSMREQDYLFGPDDVLIVGFPVYAGRIPNKIMPFIKERVHGEHTLAIPVVSFGNRNYDQALSELDDLLTENGFHVIAGAAVASEHSFSNELGTGRPDEEDMKDIREFALKVRDKLVQIREQWSVLRDNKDSISYSKDSISYSKDSITCSQHIINYPVSEFVVMLPGEHPPTKYYTPLGVDGQPAKFLKAVPVVDQDLCLHCGRCAKVCPVGSVEQEFPYDTTGICIKCHACIHSCPIHARRFTDQAFLSHREMLLKNYKRRAESIYMI